MSTQFSFNGQLITIPGAYSNIKSGVKNPPIQADYSSVLVLDTGSGAGWGGGSGIDGTLTKNKDSIYVFDNIDDYRHFVGGGLHWLLAEALFRPAGLGFRGVSTVYYAKAATTTPAEFSIDFEGDGSRSVSTYPNSNGGTFTIQVRDEGTFGNGTLYNGVLSKGYAMLMARGKVNTSKYVLKFYRGSFTGLDQNSLPYNGISEGNTTAELLVSSIEFNNVDDLWAWMLSDVTFLKYFKLKAGYTKYGTGLVDDSDLLYYSQNYTLASGGTESYANITTLLNSVLESITDLDVSFILSDKYGNNAQSNVNTTILTHIVETSKFKPELYIAAGSTVNDFDFSIQTADHFDNDSVTVCHGSETVKSQEGMRDYDSIYTAAKFLGREAGLEPQIPVTFKHINIDITRDSLTDRRAERALASGLLVGKFDNGSFDIVKGVNSLQRNQFLINSDGTTHSKQLKRIARQLNKEIIINAKQSLLKNPVGVNRATLSEDDVKTWLENYLTSKKATAQKDNLILSFQDVVVKRVADSYQITYRFVANSEISFLFFTGLVIDL